VVQHSEVQPNVLVDLASAFDQKLATLGNIPIMGIHGGEIKAYVSLIYRWTVVLIESSGLNLIPVIVKVYSYNM
jgi:hypothetical protein